MIPEIPYLKGESKFVYSAAPADADERWFINDHCFVTGSDGVLHMIGINNPYPPEGKQLYRYHPYLGHATSTDPMHKWLRQPPALDDMAREEYLGAPFITWVELVSKYVMMFEARHDGRRGLELAWSDDLHTWERTLQRVPADYEDETRDPCIIRDADGSFLLYLATLDPLSSISVYRTVDFSSFEGPRCCLHIDDELSYGGLESPFVLKRKGLYYLFFTHAHRHYYETVVIVSDRYDSFLIENAVTTLHGHASEIFTFNGTQYISSCGPEGNEPLNRHGLYLTELAWAVAE